MPQKKKLQRRKQQKKILKLKPHEVLPSRVKTGRQTQVTRLIDEFASRFPGVKMKSVKQIVNEVSSFKRVPTSFQELKKVYCQRTASEIIESRKVFVLNRKQRTKHKLGVHGCLDYCLALTAILRAKGVPAKFVRAFDHSYVWAKIEGKWFSLDPTNRLPENRVKPLRELKPLFDLLKKEKSLAVGLDAWDLGLHSLNDFNKFVSPEAKKKINSWRRLR